MKTVITPPSDINIYSKNKAWVDATYGDDSTGEVDNMAKPFATMQAAANALKPFVTPSYNANAKAEIYVARGLYTDGIVFDATFTPYTEWKIIFANGASIVKNYSITNLHVFKADVQLWLQIEGPVYIEHYNSAAGASVFGPGFEFQRSWIDGKNGMVIINTGWSIFNGFANLLSIKNIAGIYNYAGYITYVNSPNTFENIGNITNTGSGLGFNNFWGELTFINCKNMNSGSGPLVDIYNTLTLQNCYVKGTVSGHVLVCYGFMTLDNTIVHNTYVDNVNGPKGNCIYFYHPGASYKNFQAKNDTIIKTDDPLGVALRTEAKTRTRLYGDLYVKGAVDPFVLDQHQWIFVSVVPGDTLQIKLPWSTDTLTYVVQPGDTPNSVALAFQAAWLNEVILNSGNQFDLYFNNDITWATANLTVSGGTLTASPNTYYFNYANNYSPSLWYNVIGTSVMAFTIITNGDGFVNLIPGSQIVQSQYL